MVSDTTIGFIACVIATIGFGSMIVPIKKFDIGNGLFVQFAQSIGIMIVGIIINVIRGSPQFYLLAALSGVIWSIGNLCVVPVIQCLGMGVGMLMWTTSQLLIGWASGRFGLFGLKANIPSSEPLNYVGMILSLLGGLAFALVDADNKKGADNEAVGVVNAALNLEEGGVTQPTQEKPNEKSPQPSISAEVPATNHSSEEAFFRNLTPWKRRTFGVVLALFAGFFFGTTFNPVVYVQERYDGASKNGLDFVLAAFTGTFFMATFYMMVYSAYRLNKPDIRKELFLPSVIYGIIWAIAQSSWFVANPKLSQAITTPILGRLPALIASAWGVFLFKEVQGRKNYMILAAGCSVTIVGSVLTGLSKSL